MHYISGPSGHLFPRLIGFHPRMKESEVPDGIQTNTAVSDN